MRVASGDDKFNLDLVRSVKIKCTCANNSFEGSGFICWPRRDRVSISFGALAEIVSISFGALAEIVLISFRALKPRSCVNFAEIVCQFRRNRLSISPVFIGVQLNLENLHRGGEL